MKHRLPMTITLSVVLSTGFTFSAPAADARISLADLLAAIEALAVCPDTGGARFVDNGDGTICDTETGLMWEMKDAGGVAISTTRMTWITNTRGRARQTVIIPTRTARPSPTSWRG